MTKPWESIIPEVQEKLDEEKPSFVSRFTTDLGRSSALAGRTVVEGLHDMATPFSNLIAYGANRGIDAYEQHPLRVATGAPTTDFRFPEQSQAFSQQLTSMGVPEPQTGAENVANLVGRIGTGYSASNLMTPRIMQQLGFKLPDRSVPPPSAEQLRGAAAQAYQAADDAGVTISQNSLAPMIRNIATRVRDQGFDEQLHPRAARALERLTGTNGDISFNDLEILRRVVKNAASSADASERRIAQIMIGQLDDYVSGLSASDVVAGNATQASTAIREARTMYARASKASEIEDIMQRARTSAPNFSASGLENAVRTQFRQLANNPRRMRMFSRMEQEAIRRVAEGGPLENSLRMLGKLAPTGVVSGGLGLGGGYMLGGPLGAATVAGAGLSGRRLATELTLRNANAVSEMVRGGTQQAGTLTRETAIASGASPAVVNFLFGIEGEEPAQAKKPWER